MTDFAARVQPEAFSGEGVEGEALGVDGERVKFAHEGVGAPPTLPDASLSLG